MVSNQFHSPHPISSGIVVNHTKINWISSYCHSNGFILVFDLVKGKDGSNVLVILLHKLVYGNSVEVVVEVVALNTKYHFNVRVVEL